LRASSPNSNADRRGEKHGGSSGGQGRDPRRVDAGYIWINGVGTHYRGVPYGGTKNSGVGTEEGLDELMSYTEIKSINIVMG